jgi:hypothetical protein
MIYMLYSLISSRQYFSFLLYVFDVIFILDSKNSLYVSI